MLLGRDGKKTVRKGKRKKKQGREREYNACVWAGTVGHLVRFYHTGGSSQKDLQKEEKFPQKTVSGKEAGGKWGGREVGL